MRKSWRIQNERTHQDLQMVILGACIEFDDVLHGKRSCFREDIITLAEFLEELLANFNKFNRHEVDYDPDQLQLFQSICVRLFREQMRNGIDLGEIFRQEILSPMQAIALNDMPEKEVLEKFRSFCNTLNATLVSFLRPHVLCKHTSICA